MLKVYFVLLICAIPVMSCSKNVFSSYVGHGWGNNSVNTVKFRKNALTTFGAYQFVGYYDQDSYLILGKRTLNSKKWTTFRTPYKGNTKDAHNAISIAVDGHGYLHVSWDHHDTSLRYAKSKQPFSLELHGEISMTQDQEDQVTYPEFYNLPNGNLLFFYRSGKSGRGNLVLNSYDLKTGKWKQLQNNLIDGENIRSAYWQACVDNQGVIHVSWVWRETWDVETNHDLCYAKSMDGGKTWKKSNGEKYQLPITLGSAEYAWKISQKSNLINQTAMCTDKNGDPFIATYWNENNIPQYQVVYLDDGSWKKMNTAFRKTPFILGGGGTKKIPMSRPDIFIDDSGKRTYVNILFRDEERNNKVSLAYTSLRETPKWEVMDLTNNTVGQWEPNFDISLWKSKKELHIFVQNVTQIDSEGLASRNTSEVNVLEIENLRKLQDQNPNTQKAKQHF